MSPTARIASDGVLVGMEEKRSAIRHVPGFDSGWRGYNHQRLWIPRLEISRMTGRGSKGCARFYGRTCPEKLFEKQPFMDRKMHHRRAMGRRQVKTHRVRCAKSHQNPCRV